MGALVVIIWIALAMWFQKKAYEHIEAPFWVGFSFISLSMLCYGLAIYTVTTI